MLTLVIMVTSPTFWSQFQQQFEVVDCRLWSASPLPRHTHKGGKNGTHTVGLHHLDYKAEWHKEQTLEDHQCKPSLSMPPWCASLHACTQLSASRLAVVPQRRSTVRCGCERAAGSTGQLHGWLATTEPLLYSKEPIKPIMT